MRQSVGGLEGVLFAHGGKVYMIATSSTSQGYRDLIESVEIPKQSAQSKKPQENVAAQDRKEFASPDPLPEPGLYPEYLGLTWDGDENRQCVWAAREFAKKKLGVEIPLLGKSGVAADLWEKDIPGLKKVENGGKDLPTPGALVIWGRQLRGTGHVGVVLGPVEATSQTIRIIDSNLRLDYKGRVHDVTLDDPRILGWLAPE